VEEVSLERFAMQRAIWIRGHSTARFDSAEVISRARSRLGEDRYRLFSNNCEHFCEWCLRDEHRSYQVERLLALPRQLARIWADAIARLRVENDEISSRPIRVLHALPQSAARNLGRQSKIAGHFLALDR
jgi:hypothetical protein